jgi:hypothetical protein
MGCVAWVFYRVAQSGLWDRVAHSSHARGMLQYTAAAACVYAMGVALLACAWWFLQRTFSARGPGLGDTVVCYAVTQFGKYLPGNVVQYIGRHAVLRRWGLSHTSLLACAVAEAGLLVSASLIWGAGLIDQLIPGLPGWTVATAVVLASLAVVIVLARLRRSWNWLSTRLPAFLPGNLLVAGAFYLFFFGVMAFTLELVARPLGDFAQTSPLLLPATAALSWVAGYLVIGAPAGIGVREAVFLLLLKGYLPQDDTLLLVAGFRLATFAGDLLAFLAGLPFSARLRDRTRERQPAKAAPPG